MNNPKWYPKKETGNYCRNCEHMPDDYNSCMGCAWNCKQGYLILGMHYNWSVTCKDFKEITTPRTTTT